MSENIEELLRRMDAERDRIARESPKHSRYIALITNKLKTDILSFYNEGLSTEEAMARTRSKLGNNIRKKILESEDVAVSADEDGNPSIDAAEEKMKKINRLLELLGICDEPMDG